jgi:hypothetical protein
MENWPFFLYREREREKNPENGYFSWLILPFLANPMVKVNIFSFLGIFKISQFCRPFPKILKYVGEIENFVSSARGLVIGKAPVRTTENRARMYMYVCMYVWTDGWKNVWKWNKNSCAMPQNYF